MSTETDQYRQAAEDTIRSCIDGMPEAHRWIAYFYLRNMYGCRIEGIEYKIDELIRQAVKK